MGTELKVLRFVGVALLLFAVNCFTPQKAYGEDKGQDRTCLTRSANATTLTAPALQDNVPASVRI